MLRQRTLRAARRTRQSEKRLGGPSPGQVTDLAGAVPTLPGEAFSRAVERFAEPHVFGLEIVIVTK